MTASQRLLVWLKHNAIARRNADTTLLLVCMKREMQNQTSAPSKTWMPSNFELDDEMFALTSTINATYSCSAR